MTTRNPGLPILLVFLATLACPHPTPGQGMSDVKIETTKVADGVYMLQGRGGNIGLSVGEDGVFMIDDQYAPLSERILEAIRGVSDRPVRFLVNTHWHADHTGGNEQIGKRGAIIVAHEEVRRRLTADQFIEEFKSSVPASPEAALPVVTFTDAVTFHWNGEEIRVFHVAPAHTDGDSIVHLRRANVIHAGDVFFNGLFPFIDVSSGGSIDGMIAAVDRVLPLCDAKTRIIPGHGPLGDAKALRAYRAMLAAVRDRVRKMVDDGLSREDVIAAHPTREFDADWGHGFLAPDRWVGIVYDGMTRAR